MERGEQDQPVPQGKKLRDKPPRGKRPRREEPPAEAIQEAPEGGQPREKPSPRKSRTSLVDRAIEKIEDDLEKNQLKGSLGDLIRLLQLRKEMEEEEPPREIKISWVEPHEEGHATEK